MTNWNFVIYVSENSIDRSICSGSLITALAYEKSDRHFVDWAEDIG